MIGMKEEENETWRVMIIDILRKYINNNFSYNYFFHSRFVCHTQLPCLKIIQRVFDSFALHNRLDKTPIIDSITDTPEPLKARFENKNSFQVIIIRAASN